MPPPSITGALGALPSRPGEASVTARILPVVLFTFVVYLTVGMLLATLPAYVHLRLGVGTLLAGVVVSLQYVATLVTRPQAGRMSDVHGPRRAVVLGLVACAASGLSLVAAPALEAAPALAVGVLAAGRLALGAAESYGSTGATLWGVARVGHGRIGRVISWNGLATYGALALGAPLGVVLERRLGLAAVGLLVAALSAAALALALRVEPAAGTPGERAPFGRIVRLVALHGTGLALASIGPGVVAAFVTLYYAERGWPGAAAALSLFGVGFMGGRLLFSAMIDRLGGYPVAAGSFAVELAGLALLGLAAVPLTALVGAALTGFGFSAIFPALGVEAVRHVPGASRGAALGAYTAFLDVSLFAAGPAAGAVIGGFGYPAAFLCSAGAVVLALVLTLALRLRA